MNGIRLKCSLDPMQMMDRLQYKPELIELQLFEEDLLHIQQIRSMIRLLKGHGVKVYLHHPMKHKGEYLDILSRSPQVRAYYDWSCNLLAEICRKEEVYCVVHPHYSRSECSDAGNKELRHKVKERIKSILENGGEFFLWENTIEGIFSFANPFLVEELVKPLNLPLCVDISHVFISVKGSNKRLRDALILSQNHARYFHVVDSMGVKHDSLPLGEGKVNWRMVAPFLKKKDYVFEIGLTDLYDSTPMVESAAFLEKEKAPIKGL